MKTLCLLLLLAAPLHAGVKHKGPTRDGRNLVAESLAFGVGVTTVIAAGICFAVRRSAK